MPYFQNVFPSDFVGVLIPRQDAPTFKCPKNAGRSGELVAAWNREPYNLNINDADGNSRADLIIYFALDQVNWVPITINVASGAASATAVKASEIATNLNANTTFATYFSAVLSYNNNIPYLQIKIKPSTYATRVSFYIANGRAEEAIRFNARAGVAELPTYLARHTIANKLNYVDSQGILIQLATTGVDAAIINNATDYRGVSLGYSSSTVQDDWELLKGRSSVFTFKKVTVDGSDRITQIIEYSAGCVTGDFARLIKYTYTGANKNPDQITEEPYTLAGGDLVTP